MKLTKRAIDALQPRQSEYFVWDDTIAGFGVRVHPTGRKVYLLRYRTATNTQRKLTIGKPESMGLDDARQAAREAIVRAAKGEDPTAERKTLRSTDTLAELKAAYHKAREGHIKPQSLACYESYWKHHIGKRLGGVKVIELTALQVQELHSDLRTRPYEANRCLQYLKAMLNYAEKMKVIPRGTNPAYDVTKYREKPRQTILTPVQVQEVLKALARYKPRTKSAPYLLKLLILTGLRRNEWAHARWEWVNWLENTIHLPDTKTGERTVYLPDAAVAVLHDLRRMSNSDWIFPNEHGDNHITHMARHWAKVQALAGVKGIRIHDLRHTVGSLGHRAGLSQRQIADLLGHKNMRTTARYIHDGLEQHKAANHAAAAMLGELH